MLSNNYLLFVLLILDTIFHRPNLLSNISVNIIHEEFNALIIYQNLEITKNSSCTVWRIFFALYSEIRCISWETFRPNDKIFTVNKSVFKFFVDRSTSLWCSGNGGHFVTPSCQLLCSLWCEMIMNGVMWRVVWNDDVWCLTMLYGVAW